MTTYFHGGNPEMETDGSHTLYLMNPNYISAYNSASSSEHHHQQQQQTATTQQQNMILLNSALPHAQSHPHVSHAPPPLQSQFLTLPFAHPISADDPSRSANIFQYNSWSGGRVGGGQVEVSGGLSAATTHPYRFHLDNNDVFRRPAVVSPTTKQQGLSLSLSSQPGHGVVGGSTSSGVQVAVAGEDSNNGVTNFIIGSKYLKAAQELLDEVVNVGKATTTERVKKEKVKVAQMDGINNGENEAAGTSEPPGGGSGRAASAEHSMTQRQEIQMKKTKLISMLDEVEQRYGQYHHQMKAVVTSFEQVAGFGSARSYASLALRTISKQFRCLKDAITSQIKEASKSLGEEAGDECLGVKGEGSRLRMIDHRIRQQRALQQLGMIQHNNAWRPQRGLPERAVSVLRAWLFEHFLHPYPKDLDKHMLAKQTGLTRNQVSNWFINARVRLWKPMVEEMYLEEVKDPQEQKGLTQDNSTNNGESSTIDMSNDPSYKQQQSGTNGQLPLGTQTQNTSPNDISNNSVISTSPNAAPSFQAPPHSGFNLIGPSSSGMDGLLLYKKPRGMVPEMQNSPSSILSAGEVNFSRHDHQNSNLMAKFGASLVGYSIGQDHSNNSGGGFGAYHHQLGELGRFSPNHHHQRLAQSFHHSNNGNVSLTLGLPPGENLPQNYFSSQNMHGFDRRVEMVGDGGGGEADDHSNMGFHQGSSPHSNMGFQSVDIQNRKRYAAAAAPLLPDFVA